jgi:hypothetical protein
VEKRPKIKIYYSIYEVIIELISIIAIFINVYLLLKYYKVLPNVIPTHLVVQVYLMDMVVKALYSYLLV